MLRLLVFGLGIVLCPLLSLAQVTTIPAVPSLDQPVTIIFDARQGNAGLINYSGKVYIHTGVITTASTQSSDWKCVVTNWGQDIDSINLMTRDPQNPNIYRLQINDIRAYYNKGSNCLGNSRILKLAMVFRNEGPTPNREGKGPGNTDIFVDVAQQSDLVTFSYPKSSAQLPAFAISGDKVSIRAIAQTTTSVNTLRLLLNGNVLTSVNNDTINFDCQTGDPGSLNIIAEATFTNQTIRRDTLRLMVIPKQQNQAVPQGLKDGINYHPTDSRQLTLVLYAPKKQFVHLIGDVNNWQISDAWLMNRHQITPDSTKFWITLNNLTPGQEYGFQYLVDGSIRVTDPYVNKILDPEDRFISSSTYPNLKPYPTGKTEYQVGVLQPGKTPYQWQVTNFTPPAKDKLVIYELLLRDFVGTRSYETLIDTLDYLQRLGINAIELMPVNEFDGNSSWGYNPGFHLALDKAYGTEHAFKRFIDEAHKRGIAVILDIVLNHATGQSPLVRLYNAGGYSNVVEGNPWFNLSAPEPLAFFNDFNQASPATRYFAKRVMEYWIREFKIDGYRFDLSKGFTQRKTTNFNDWAKVDVFRINLWKEYADFIWDINPNVYVILEHFAENVEERQLADYGMMLWGNLNYNFNESTMGFTQNSNLNSLSYKNRSWQKPHLIGYMESHDEERIMYKNLNFGSVSNNYNTRDLNTALERTKAAAAFLILTPGPKMMWQFGELGYAQSINRCTNGTISDACRLSEKPLPWNNIYLNNNNQRLFKVYSELIHLKKTQPALSTSEFLMDAAGPQKRLVMTHPDMDVLLLGNFALTDANIIPGFTKTGTWYDYFRGTSLQVTDTHGAIPLLAGEFRLYTTKKIDGNRRGLVSTTIDELNPERPTQVRLLPNYPNPFNPTTTLHFELPKTSPVTIDIYDILGRRVAQALNTTLHAGTHQFIFDGSNLSSGTYLVRLTTDTQSLSTKMMLLK
jgi:glycosidase